MYGSRIKATGYYVPGRIVTNDDLSELVETNDEWILSRTGIGQRRIATQENTSDLAAKAAEDILKNGGVAPEEIDLILVATISGDYQTPSTACLVQAKIGAVNAVAMDLTAACSGFVYALSCADKFLRVGQYKKALVIGAEVLSKEVDWSDRSTCILFGDGAGGVLLEQCPEAEKGVLAEKLGSDGTKAMSLTGGDYVVANHFNGVEAKAASYLQMDGREIFKFATKQVPINMEALLSENNISKDEINYVVLHQANDRIIQAVAKKLDMPLEKFYRNMFYYGNTSSASIPIALAEMCEENLIAPGEKIVISGFGGGLTWGSMLLQL
jgi:3-oxoacyl-[acyl-carrier-protein] synthase-3